MKKLIYILLTLSIFYGCQEDKEVGFDITIPQENISFQPTAGGAIMRYRLPADPDILSIRVRYQDAFGKEILRTGSYACDSLFLVGFNEARQGVLASITLCNRNNVESAPLEIAFDTKDSGPVAFFEQLEEKQVGTDSCSHTMSPKMQTVWLTYFISVKIQKHKNRTHY